MRLVEYLGPESTQQIVVNPLSVDAVEPVSGGRCRLYIDGRTWEIAESYEDVSARFEVEWGNEAS
jgi:hypothetical protein